MPQHVYLAILFCLTWLAACAVPAVQAQGTDPAPAPAAGTPDKDLSTSELQLLRDYERFEKSLFDVGEQLRRKDPERAELLYRARSQSQELNILAEMQSIAELLRMQNSAGAPLDPQYGPAADRQKEVLARMKGVLRLLQSQDERERVAAEIARIQDLLKDTNRIIARQKDVRADTQRSKNSDRTKDAQKRVNDEAQKLSEKIEKQDQERQEKKSGEKGSDEKQPRQKSPDSDQNPAGEEQDSGSPKGEKSGGKESQPSGKPDGKPQGKNPEQDGSKEENSEKSPSMPESDEPSQGEPESEKGQSEKDASGQPKSGKNQSGKPQSGKNQPGQESQESPQGEKSEESQSQQPSPDSQQTAGREQLEQARQKMQQAIEKLEQEQKDKAVEDQDQAVNKLEELKAQLEQILRQLREDERESYLTMLEARFQNMLKRQQHVNSETIRLDRIAAADRAQQNFASQTDNIRKEQEDNALEAEKALHLLKEEGSSVAFPEAVEQMHQNMMLAAGRLSRQETGQTTQLIEKMVADTLEEMIAAFRQELQKQQEKEQGQQGGGQGEPQDPALINQLAELKLIRSLQNQINVLTKQIGTEVVTGTSGTPEQLQLIQDLRVRQERIQQATYDLSVGRNQ